MATLKLINAFKWVNDSLQSTKSATTEIMIIEKQQQQQHTHSANVIIMITMFCSILFQ